MSDITSGQAASAAAPGRAHGVPFAEAFWVWVRVAALSFGGPAGQIAVMHRIVVDEKRWIGEHRFLHALSYCTLLPGPEAQQLAIYIGWLMHRTIGGLVPGGFLPPGAQSQGELFFRNNRKRMSRINSRISHHHFLNSSARPSCPLPPPPSCLGGAGLYQVPVPMGLKACMIS